MNCLRVLYALLAVPLLLATSANAQNPKNLDAARSASPARTAPAKAAVMSAVVEDDIFLQGTFIGLGISGAGSFGTDNSAPSGFLAPRGRLGYVFDNDGIGMGDDPLTGDFFLPGSPEEGFGIGYLTEDGNQSTAQVFINVERENRVNVNQTSVADLSTGSTLAAEYIGVSSDDVLQVKQTVSFNENDRRVAVVIELTNLGAEEIFDVRYIRNVDPDQDVDTGGSFSTDNTVLSNFPDDSRAVVRAVGLDSGEPFFYVATDSRLRASYGGFSTPSPYTSFVYDSPAATGVTSRDDEAVTMTADVGGLAPGETKSFQFFLGFDTDIASDPLLTLAATPLSIAEGASSTITATISEPSDEDVVVTLAFSGTTDASDYSVPATITIPMGSTSASITLTAVDDADTTDETVRVDIASATNAVEQGEQSATITITPGAVELLACSAEVALGFGDFDPDGGDATYDEFAELQNSEMTGVDLSPCSFATFDPFTERVIYTTPVTGTVDAASSYVFATQDGDQMIPSGSIFDGPGAFILLEGTTSVGASVADVLDDVVAGLVYVAEDDVFAQMSGGGTVMSREEQRAAFLAGLARLAQVVSEEDGVSGIALDVTAAPNPLRDRTTVTFGVADAADVRVAVYDALGRQVALLADAPYGAGRHELTLDARDLPAGVYVVRALVGADARTARVTITR